MGLCAVGGNGWWMLVRVERKNLRKRAEAAAKWVRLRIIIVSPAASKHKRSAAASSSSTHNPDGLPRLAFLCLGIVSLSQVAHLHMTN